MRATPPSDTVRDRNSHQEPGLRLRLEERVPVLSRGHTLSWTTGGSLWQVLIKRLPLPLCHGAAAKRYGEYFGAGTDPVPTWNSTFWVSGEYRANSVNPDWNTVIAEVGSFAPDFAMSAKPSNISMQAGSTGNSTITITGYKFAGNTSLTSSIIPTGLSCTLNPSVVFLAASDTSKLSCSGSEGNYNVTATGTSGSISHSVSIPATVQPSSSVGGSIVPINEVQLLLASVAPGLAVLMTFLLGSIMSNLIKRKKTS